MLPFNDILQFTVPCWLINLSLNLIYILKTKVPSLVKYDFPLDNHKSFSDGQRILGNSTTWPGLLIAIGSGLVISEIFFSKLWIGLMVGLSVYFGHALGSFIKRRAKYPDGKFMLLVDHGDYIVTTGILLGLLHQFSWIVIGLGVVLTYLVHPIVTYLAYLINWHKYPL